MRVILQDGVERLIDRIVQVIADGCADGSILTPRDPQAVARALYGLWLGAAILSKLGKDIFANISRKFKTPRFNRF